MTAMIPVTNKLTSLDAESASRKLLEALSDEDFPAIADEGEVSIASPMGASVKLGKPIPLEEGFTPGILTFPRQ
ncbi:MAG TPA: hypothetical protein VNQ76_17385 [Planctomicrobium sp.]|nr:hypothetical protein [Planctomicrobium sp.]